MGKKSKNTTPKINKERKVLVIDLKTTKSDSSGFVVYFNISIVNTLSKQYSTVISEYCYEKGVTKNDVMYVFKTTDNHKNSKEFIYYKKSIQNILNKCNYTVFKTNEDYKLFVNRGFEIKGKLQSIEYMSDLYGIDKNISYFNEDNFKTSNLFLYLKDSYNLK